MGSSTCLQTEPNTLSLDRRSGAARYWRWISLFAAAIAAAGCATTDIEVAGWLEIEASHVTIVTDGDEQWAVGIARDLEDLRSWAGIWMGVDAVRATGRPRIYLFRDYASFEPFEYQLWSDGYFVAGLDGGAVAVNGGAGPRGAIEAANHELTHFMLWSSSRRDYPIWYHEGLAGLLSTAVREGGVVRVGRPPDSVAANLSDSRGLAIEAILSARGLGDWYGASRHAFYAKAWALVHMLRIGSVDDPARVRKLNTFLRRFGRDQDEGTSLAAVLGVESEELGRQLDRYIAEEVFRELEIPGADAAVSDAALRIRALSETEANFRLFELAEKLGTRHRDEARVLLDRVLQLDPDHARALANLGFLDREDREPEETAKLLERAVELAPSDPAIRNLVGRYLLERAEQFAAESAESGDDIGASINARLMRQQSVIMARTHLTQSVALAPEFAEGHYWLGVASLVDDDHYRLGRRSLEKARELAPWSAEVSLRLAEINLRVGHPFRARRLLESVVGSAHSPDQAERARELLEELGPRRGREASESERD